MQLITPEMTLKTARLLLEPLHISHAQFFYLPLQDKGIYTYIPQDPPISPEALATRYQVLATRLSPDQQEAWLNWAMFLRNEQVYVGTLQATVHADATAELAYILFPPFWGHGYAKEGCKRILEHLFSDYQVKLVAAQIDTRNQASIRLVEALGFQRIATRLQADFFKGATSDEYHYELHSPHKRS